MTGLVRILTCDLAGPALHYAVGQATLGNSFCFISSVGEVLYPNRKLGDFDLYDPEADPALLAQLVSEFKPEYQVVEVIDPESRVVAKQIQCFVAGLAGDAVGRNEGEALCKAVVLMRTGLEVYLPGILLRLHLLAGQSQ